jgi:ABC-type antimicrobial peptide transport system permease subunit
MLPLYEIDFSTLFYANGDSLPTWSDGVPTVLGVSPPFFTTTGLRVLRGRALTASDIAAGNIAVVNETLARTSWPTADALGQCLRIGKNGPCFTIVGVVQDSRRAQLIEKPVRQMYVALQKSGDYAAESIVLRVPPKRATAVEVAARREVIAAIPGSEPRIRRLADTFAPQYRPWELGATLFSVFGVLALIVAAVGVFSTLSHDISQRRHDLGVRVALGATLPDMVRLVIGDGVRVVAIGTVTGVALAITGGRLIASLLYGVAPNDPLTVGLVGVLLLLVAILASTIPALRAARTDPLEALRAD